MSVSNNVATFTPSTGNHTMLRTTDNLPLISGHKYLFSFDVKATATATNCYVRTQNNTSIKNYTANTSWNNVAGIFTSTQNDYFSPFFRYESAFISGLSVNIKDVNVIDLTQWFGSDSIPDAAYTKEQSTAGSGIAWLKEQGFDFSKYISYNTGTLESVNPSAKKVVGFNLWDEEWEVGVIASDGSVDASFTNRRTTGFIQVQAGETYYQKSPQNAYWGRYAFYDENKNCIYFNIDGFAYYFTAPENAKYVRISFNQSYGTTYNHDICINISKPTGTPKNGDYLPYEEHTNPISPSPLRGLFTLVDDTIKASGDVRKSDGSTQRSFGVVDLGSLEWVTFSQSGNTMFDASLTGIKGAGNIMCPKYLNGVDYGWANLPNGYLRTYTDGLRIKDDSYSDAATFKTAMNGVYLEYELATPTTESLPPFDNPQISIVGGTEEFITDNDVPVGHESEYKKLPPLFEDDYIQTIQERAENVMGEIEKKADNTTKTQPNYYHQYDSTTHKFSDTTRTFNPYDVANILDIMENTRQALETAINDHASLFSQWTFLAEVNSSGASVTIPSSAVRILVELYVIDFSSGNETHVICASLDAEANNPVRDEYIELHGTALNADHYVTGKAIGTDTWITTTNAVARVYYRK